MLEDGLSSDCVLSCGVEKFPAHKCVLSARSEVFKQLLSGSTSRIDVNDPKQKNKANIGSNSGLVEFDDVDPQVSWIKTF
jgi:hypothetical protein